MSQPQESQVWEGQIGKECHVAINENLHRKRRIGKDKVAFATGYTNSGGGGGRGAGETPRILYSGSPGVEAGLHDRLFRQDFRLFPSV